MRPSTILAARFSIWINWGRHTLGTIPFVLVGSTLFDASGVLIGQAVGGLIFAAIALILALRVMADSGDSTGGRPFFSQRPQLIQLFEHRR